MRGFVNLLLKTAFMNLKEEYRHEAVAIRSGGIEV